MVGKFSLFSYSYSRELALNPNHLLTFAVVARFNSITQAAKFLNLGQPAVSGQLKLLQGEVGEPLYERKGHKIELTSAGKGLLEHALKVQRELEQAIEYTRNLQDISAGVLRIGATMTITNYFLPYYVARLQHDNPGVQVYMETADTREIVSNIHNYDLGFVEGAVSSQQMPFNYQLIPWLTDEIVMILPDNHPLCFQYPDAVPLDVFETHQIIWREPGSGARQAVETALNQANIKTDVKIAVTGVTGIKECVRAGLGLGFASVKALRHESTGLVSRRIAPPVGLLWQLNIVAPLSEHQSRVSQAFLALCDFPLEYE